MQPRRRRKKIRLKPRFYTIVLTFFIMIFAFFFLRQAHNQVPNLHGWESAAVIEFATEFGLDLEFDFSYSSTVAPTLVMKQSVAPGTRIEPGMRLTIEISKGIEVR